MVTGYCTSAHAADNVVINAAIVAKADTPEDVVVLGTDVAHVTLEGSIALWEIAPAQTTPNTADQVTLAPRLNYSGGASPLWIPPVIPNVTDVRLIKSDVSAP